MFMRPLPIVGIHSLEYIWICPTLPSFHGLCFGPFPEGKGMVENEPGCVGIWKQWGIAKLVLFISLYTFSFPSPKCGHVHDRLKYWSDILCYAPDVGLCWYYHREVFCFFTLFPLEERKLNLRLSPELEINRKGLVFPSLWMETCRHLILIVYLESWDFGKPKRSDCDHL